MTTLPDIDDRLDRIETMLRELADRSGVPQRWLRVRQAAEYAGVGTTTVRGWLAAGRLITHRPARGLILLDRLELDSFILAANGHPRTSRGNGEGTRFARQQRMQVPKK